MNNSQIFIYTNYRNKRKTKQKNEIKLFLSQKMHLYMDGLHEIGEREKTNDCFRDYQEEEKHRFIRYIHFLYYFHWMIWNF